jgi:hypothetical protein
VGIADGHECGVIVYVRYILHSSPGAGSQT